MPNDSCLIFKNIRSAIANIPFNINPNDLQNYLKQREKKLPN